MNPVQDFISGCDVALIVGSILPYRSTAGVCLRMPESLIHILLDGDAIGKNHPASVPIVANSKAALTQILSLMGDKDVDKGDSFRREIGDLRDQIYEGLKEQWPSELYALEAMRSVLPPGNRHLLGPHGANLPGLSRLPLLPTTHVHAPSWLVRPGLRGFRPHWERNLPCHSLQWSASPATAASSTICRSWGPLPSTV